jgi:hypothetical protein
LLVGERVFGSEARYGMVQGRPTVVRVEESVLRALFRQPVDLVSAVASGVEPADIKTVRIDGPGGDFTLERDLERWIAPDFENVEIENAAVNRLLELLTRVHAPSVVIEPFPRRSSVARITLFGYGRNPLDTVQIARVPGATPDEDQWILENGDGVLRVFSARLDPPLAPKDYGLE